MTLIALERERLIWLQKATCIHDENRQISHTGTPVRTREPKLPYQWALVSILFKALQKRPHYCHNRTIYITLIRLSEFLKATDKAVPLQTGIWKYLTNFVINLTKYYSSHAPLTFGDDLFTRDKQSALLLEICNPLQTNTRVFPKIRK